MRHTITGLVDKPVDAQRIIDELMTRCLTDRSDLSLITQDTAGMGAGVARAAGEVASSAGSAVAKTISGLFDVASAATRPVPGFGVLRAFGQLGALLSRTVLATGEDLTKAFVNFGIDSDLARRYSDALREGRILMVVDAKTDNMARCARQVMATHGATMPEARAAH